MARIGVDMWASSDALHGAMQGAFAAGAGRVEVVARSPDGRPVALSFGRPRRYVRGRVELALRVRSTDLVLQSTAGDVLTIPDRGGTFDVAELNTKLRERRMLEPNRSDLRLVPEPGLPVGRLLRVAGVARRHLPELALERAR